MTKHKAIRIKPGYHYYRGCNITKIPYCPAEQRLVWVATDEYGTEIYRGFTMDACKSEIDNYIDNLN